MTRSSIAIFLILLISGCTTLPAPDWVEGKSEYYTTKTYLLGHGVGQNELAAKDSAIQQVQYLFKAITNEDELNSQANIIFNQIQFEETWININSGQYHILAFISRNKAASLIHGKMLALDELTYEFFEQAKSTTDLLEQTSYINSAINAQSRRVDLKSVLKIITTESDIPSSYNLDRLTKIRNQLQARVNLKLKIKQDKIGGLDKIMKNSLDLAGFIRNANIKSKNLLIVDLKIDKSDIAKTSGALFLKGVLTISLQHQGDESMRGQHQWSFSVTADNHQSLIKKTREILTTHLNSNLKRKVMAMMVIEYNTEEAIPNQDYKDFDMPEFNAPAYQNTADKKDEENISNTIKSGNSKQQDKNSQVTNDKAIKAESEPTKKTNPESTALPPSKSGVVVPTPVNDSNAVTPSKSKPQSESTVSENSDQKTEKQAKPVTAAETEKKVADEELNGSSISDIDDPISTLPDLEN